MNGLPAICLPQRMINSFERQIKKPDGALDTIGLVFKVAESGRESFPTSGLRSVCDGAFGFFHKRDERRFVVDCHFAQCLAIQLDARFGET